ncbi:tetrahydromethanopterin S-methyltransferase subunit A [Methanocaldococcus villosus KIN24-T80]|uniref:Tetrahydromethanopterin S-methyltransferase subunit A n=1 Tax=Methanocaldococcus villosus KIN24-T80 TaxID=1069083 RepID=N6UVU7_9EURY|nr:tetrahydromethanopterin S-methyltransferase subunit F [Methanocaldococcus villosus]ENN96454.1 tetrahydromethanopterin S-methyltransferase subunit A [Methanocaldococcus villosus KIN24-T80]
MSEIEGIPKIVKPDLEYCDKMLERLEYKVGLITRDLGLSSGIHTKSTSGFIIGAALAIVLVGIPIIIKILL